MGPVPPHRGGVWIPWSPAKNARNSTGRKIIEKNKKTPRDMMLMFKKNHTRAPRVGWCELKWSRDNSTPKLAIVKQILSAETGNAFAHRRRRQTTMKPIFFCCIRTFSVAFACFWNSSSFDLRHFWVRKNVTCESRSTYQVIVEQIGERVCTWKEMANHHETYTFLLH